LDGVPTPIVSATPTCCTPMSFIMPASISTRSGATSPSYGQPTTQDIAPRTNTPLSRAAATTGRKRSMLCAMLQLMLRWLKASLAAPNTTISSGQKARSSATAASKPCMLGVSTE
jgi:hypothetical protein